MIDGSVTHILNDEPSTTQFGCSVEKRKKYQSIFRTDYHFECKFVLTQGPNLIERYIPTQNIPEDRPLS